MASDIFNELLGQVKSTMWICGIPFSGQKVNFRFYYCCINLLVVLIEEIVYFHKIYSAENFLDLTELLPCLCIGFLSMSKILLIVWKRHKIYDLTDKLEALHMKIVKIDLTGNTIIVNKMIAMKKFLKVFLILNILVVTVYNSKSIVIMAYVYLKKKEVIFHMPYGIALPFAIDSWTAWAVAYLWSVSASYVCIFFFSTVVGLYCVLTLNICNNYAVITDQIQHLDENNVDRLRDLVESHKNILKLSGDLKNIFELPNFFSVLIGSLEICALGFNLTMGSWSQVPGCLLFMLTVLLQILLMSVLGENMIQESTKVADAAYMCRWMDMDTKFKKSILILMKRSQKPQVLTAYKFSVICYGSFTKIISTSWSYFTILKAMYKPSDSIQVE